MGFEPIIISCHSQMASLDRKKPQMRLLFIVIVQIRLDL